MSDQPVEPVAAADASAAPPAASLPANGTGPWRLLAIGLGIALVLVVALVALAPWWAPILPWGASAGRSDTALTARIEALEAAQQQSRAQMQQDDAALNVAIQRAGQRLVALEQRPATSGVDIAELRGQIDKLKTAMDDLTSRVAAVEHAAQTQTAHQASGAALALVLLQVRDAVELGRPFAAQYATLAELAQGSPELSEAVAALATPAKTGVATRTVLLRELHKLANAIADANTLPPSTEVGWAGTALAKLRGLVKIRRLDGGGPAAGAAGEINSAETALAGGDLAAAVAAVDKLAGASAAAAAPWLRMARERLAVETALSRTEATLTTSLGAGPSGAASNASPTNGSAPSGPQH
jgi:hypothetical protein